MFLLLTYFILYHRLSVHLPHYNGSNFIPFSGWIIFVWQIDGKTVETVTDFIFLGSKITVGNDCSQEIKRCLLLGRKAITSLCINLCILKSRDYFAGKGPYSQSYGFSSSHVWMWELDHKKLSAEKLMLLNWWCWRRFLRVPWTARKSNQSILKEINLDYSL